MGSKRAIAVLSARLGDDHEETRQAAVMGLAQAIEDEGLKLLSQQFNDWDPWLDPRVPVTELRVHEAARQVGLTLEDVRARYEALASRFKLRLEWKPGSP